MPRNFHRRVELLVPIEDPRIRSTLVDLLALSVADTAKSWLLRSDGSYHRVVVPKERVELRSQSRLIELARGKLKVAEQAARPASRFLMAATAERSPLEGKLPKLARRRRRRNDRD
jgi:polyphosphate kinase